MLFVPHGKVLQFQLKPPKRCTRLICCFYHMARYSSFNIETPNEVHQADMLFLPHDKSGDSTTCRSGRLDKLDQRLEIFIREPSTVCDGSLSGFWTGLVWASHWPLQGCSHLGCVLSMRSSCLNPWYHRSQKCLRCS